MIERRTDGFGIAAHGLEDVGLDRRIVRARHRIFRARPNSSAPFQCR